MRKLLLGMLFTSAMTGITSVSLSMPLETIRHHEKSPAANIQTQPDSTEIVPFYFKPKSSRFIYEGNEQSIRDAGEMIERHRSEIVNGDLLIRVSGYSAAAKSEESNRNIARLRSSHVKSAYILDLGMKEEYYCTSTHSEIYGDNPRVGVTLSLYRREAEPQPVQPAQTADTLQTTEQTVAETTVESGTTATETRPETTTEAYDAQQAAPADNQAAAPYGRWRVKTNLAGWALLMVNAAAEYRFADNWSVDVPVYYSCWTTAPTYRFRTLSTQPSVRYWLKPEWKGHFFGAHLSVGQFNVSYNNRTRYQDVDGMYGVGLDYGYLFKFSDRWGLELNIGAGYVTTNYNAYYNIDNGALYHTGTKNYWGLTRCGISFTYTIK